MRVNIKFVIIFLISFFCRFFLLDAFGQDSVSPVDKNETGIALEQAFKDYEIRKQKEEEKLAAKFNSDLNLAIDDWLSSAKKAKRKKLNMIIDQKWEKLPETIARSAFRYEYYLRGYHYNILERNVIKTSALTFPYKAVVVVREEVYAEQYHHPDTSNRNDFFYTVTTIYTLNFEHRESSFILTTTDSTIVSVKNTAPKEITKF